MKKIGFVGLGNMGKFMTRNLLAKGYPVTIFDVRPEPIADLAKEGAKPAANLSQIGAGADLVFVMVLSLPQAESVVLAPGGLLDAMAAGSTIVLTSTVPQSGVVNLADRAAERGVNLIDSPVSGGVTRAEDGSLVMMAACPRKVFDECREVLLAVGSNTYHVGEKPGMGQTVKAANQLLVSIHIQATAEAMVLSQKAGVDPEMLLEIISKSVGTSCQFTTKAPLIMERDFANRGALDIQIKDLDICLKMGRDLNVPLFLGAASREAYIMADGMGYGREDACAIVKVYETASGVKVERKR